MSRLILLLLIASALVFAGAQIAMALRDRARGGRGGRGGRDGRGLPASKEDAMPAPFRTIAYLVLLALMAGTATGLLGAG